MRAVVWLRERISPSQQVIPAHPLIPDLSMDKALPLLGLSVAISNVKALTSS